MENDLIRASLRRLLHHLERPCIKLQIPKVSRASQAGLSWSLRLDVSLKLGVWSLELFPTFFV